MVVVQVKASGIETMDRLFRRADFAAENEGLEECLRERIFGRLVEADEERELEANELSALAAAGTSADGTAVQLALRKNNRRFNA